MKKLPNRTCIGCGIQKNKKDLIRIVKNQKGEINIDRTGKMPGRGAYICDDIKCLENAIRSKKIERSFEMKIEDNVYESLRKIINEQGV